MIRDIAPAKINLYLHVGGLRPDRLHDLASLFVFAEDGDAIAVTPADALSLDIVGPFAAPLLREDPTRNLVYRAALALRAAYGVSAGARIVLDKRLPIAAGIGGGSADAAAALRALVRLWGLSPTPDALARIAFRLGADVPACLDGAPIHVSGAGEALSPAPPMPPLWACLVNPLVETPTGPIFRAYDAAHPTPPTPQLRPLRNRTIAGVVDLMAATRNDLQPPAMALRPAVGATLDYLGAQPGALAARMSGSGATTFALFADRQSAVRAAVGAGAHGWWSLATRLAGA